MGRPRYDTAPDASLLTAACQGDDLAFEALYRRHVKAVYRHTCRRLARVASTSGESSFAEDITSETFLHAWRRRSDIVLGDSMLPWLLATANRVGDNYLRAARRQRRLWARLASMRDALSSGSGAAEIVVAGELGRKVGQAIGRLDARDSQVAALCILADQSVNDVARYLGMPVGTVKSRLYRARHALRHDLGRPAT
ncbi:RNA polymerase ECF family sigma subunit [Sediminihabitans luteus]|uniref:RNA polymerase ECF family sigma subunit n=1 Tax=Sediminihabitans luteus TaxID=1138585 RepID=A0A2M9CZN6_9CELL|nr:RNA polymerase sigma factor [Sediminihabitans luteus]PJJ77357.1 RNA polymerase ECF family sigma subunit [Sediminihabitans luteus]GII98808.1 siderophore-interacting protein [Sediminihabitans luteus]